MLWANRKELADRAQGGGAWAVVWAKAPVVGMLVLVAGSPVGRSRKTERGRLRDRRGLISSVVHPSVERGMGLWD